MVDEIWYEKFNAIVLAGVSGTCKIIAGTISAASTTGPPQIFDHHHP